MGRWGGGGAKWRGRPIVLWRGAQTPGSASAPPSWRAVRAVPLDAGAAAERRRRRWASLGGGRQGEHVGGGGEGEGGGGGGEQDSTGLLGVVPLPAVPGEGGQEAARAAGVERRDKTACRPTPSSLTSPHGRPPPRRRRDKRRDGNKAAKTIRGRKAKKFRKERQRSGSSRAGAGPHCSRRKRHRDGSQGGPEPRPRDIAGGSRRQPNGATLGRLSGGTGAADGAATRPPSLPPPRQRGGDPPVVALPEPLLEPLRVAERRVGVVQRREHPRRHLPGPPDHAARPVKHRQSPAVSIRAVTCRGPPTARQSPAAHPPPRRLGHRRLSFRSRRLSIGQNRPPTPPPPDLAAAGSASASAVMPITAVLHLRRPDMTPARPHGRPEPAEQPPAAFGRLAGA